MKNVFRAFRTLIVVILVVPAALPVLLYILLSLPPVQHKVTSIAERELTSLLGTPVHIGSTDFSPFNRVVLSDVSVTDSLGSPMLVIGHLGAGISYSETIWNRRPVITFAEIIDLDLRLERDSVGAPLNIDPVIARFRKKDSKGPSAFDLQVNMVVIRRSSVSYDLLSAPAPDSGRFCKDHIRLTDIRADLRAPRISDGLIEAEIKRMGADERSGLTLSNLSAAVKIDSAEAHIDNLSVEMPRSAIRFDNISIPSPLARGFDPRTISTAVTTLPDAHIAVADIAPLVPALRSLDGVIDLDIDISGSLAALNIRRFEASFREARTALIFNGTVNGLGESHERLEADLQRLSLRLDCPMALDFIPKLSESAARLADRLAPLRSLGQIDLLGRLSATPTSADFNGSLLTDCGDLDLDADISRASKDSPLVIYGDLSTSSFSPAGLLPALTGLSDVSLHAHADLSIVSGKNLTGTAGLTVESLEWRGRRYADIAAEAQFVPGHMEFSASSPAPGLDFKITGEHDLGRHDPATVLFAVVRDLDLGTFSTDPSLASADVAGEIDLSVRGTNPDNITGWLRADNLSLRRKDSPVRNIGDLMLEAACDSTGGRTITLTSAPVDARLEGNFTFKGLAAQGRELVAAVIPSVLPVRSDTPRGLEARLSVDIKADSTLTRLFSLPVDIIHPATLRASTDGTTAFMLLDIPYLKQKNKLIEDSRLTLNLSRSSGIVVLDASTNVPTKNGMMALSLLTTGQRDSLDTKVTWKIDRASDFHGDIHATTLFSRTDDGKLDTRIGILPTDLVFNDSAWHVTPAVIDVQPGLITVSDFGASRRGQTLSINGTASADTLSRVTVDLDHIDLDYVFETLAISDAVMFGGCATGKLYGQGLLSGSPMLYTPRLHVDSISYNNCVMGDADITSYLDNADKSIRINADITGAEGNLSKISGFIRPATEELVFDFDADKAPVGFLLPFMNAFTSQISGTVTGEARLAGTFKDLDITGKIFAEKVKMKLDFTNTVYEVTDSVTLSPGLITFSDVSLADRYGSTAKLSGRVTHNYFHDPTFRFEIEDASNLMVYDVGEHDTDMPWYGRIYGRGSALVTGVPGRIDIGVKMTTMPKSTFTFVLSDAEESIDYDFITFRDRDAARKDSIAALDPTPLIVRELRKKVETPEGPPSQYVMDFNVDITPQATLNLIMDPVGGDKIVAHGSGHLNMAYDSQGELEMRGEYVLNSGYYTFTLQDIIIKDFTIREGSSIKFSGDPYAAQLDIVAAYTTTANLSDLDESFLDDPELNRTNVRVNALMKVTGDMRNPDIAFGLEFPTLTSDIDRKVRSIISTEEMMGQQIIYLLALNRFYTPDYVSATHGNELVSVASSTLSSRLSSMLGQLTDKLVVAPAIRSDRGDFSDVEFDLALSSALLDNRLLLNGNFGYRDKTLNSNSFIGDFDVRYLLNRQGTIQLKAYNRYNDQNYYLKSALTTQGVGIVFKRDFDNIFSFLRPLKKKLEEKKDSVR